MPPNDAPDDDGRSRKVKRGLEPCGREQREGQRPRETGAQQEEESWCGSREGREGENRRLHPLSGCVSRRCFMLFDCPSFCSCTEGRKGALNADLARGPLPYVGNLSVTDKSLKGVAES
jgi:hypothetical protein